MSFKVEGSSCSNIQSVYIPLTATQACLLILGSVLEDVPMVGGIRTHCYKQKCRH